MGRNAAFAAFLLILSTAAAPVAAGKPSGGGSVSPQIAWRNIGGSSMQIRMGNVDATGAATLYSSPGPFFYDLGPFDPATKTGTIAIDDRGTIKLLTYGVNASGQLATVGTSTLTTTGSIHAHHIDISREGTKIAFVSGDSTQIRIWNVGSGLDPNVYATTSYVWDLAWYGDGSGIAYVEAPRTATGDVYRVYEVVGSGSTPNLLLTEPNINDFDTARTSHRLLISYGRPTTSGVGLWDPATGSYVPGYDPIVTLGSQASLKCDDSAFVYLGGSAKSAYLIKHDLSTDLESTFMKTPGNNMPEWLPAGC
jgi:WD40 repeat protein